jgi:pectin methylesterase-like acyl-CoA thioesterase
MPRKGLCLRVDPSGGGDALSLGRALALLPDPAVKDEPALPASIFVEPGRYREKLEIHYPALAIEGAGMDSTSIVWDDCARRPGPDGKPMRTFWSYTMLVAADGVRVSNLGIHNDSGYGEAVGQAVALYADADLLSFSSCRVSSRQDSLFLGPLPPSPLEGSDFGGPREVFPRRTTRQLYRSCLIEGDVDFIFGSAQALFDHCRLRSLDRPDQAGPRGYVTAPSSPEGSTLGFLFHDCDFEGECGLPPGSVFLARPWRDWAQAAFHRCRFGNHIDKRLWDDWSKPEAQERSRFAILDCRDSGGLPWRGKRLSWEKDVDEAGLARLYAAFHEAFREAFPEWESPAAPTR